MIKLSQACVALYLTFAFTLIFAACATVWHRILRWLVVGLGLLTLAVSLYGEFTGASVHRRPARAACRPPPRARQTRC